MSIDNLILIPTPFESSLAKTCLADVLRSESNAQFHCGFGPIAAAATTSQLIANYRPRRVFLVGIAGAFSGGDLCRPSPGQGAAGGESTFPCGQPPLEIGHAYRFSTVTIDGVGVGSGSDFQSAGDLGWQQISGDDQRAAIGDEIVINGNVLITEPNPGSVVGIGSAENTIYDTAAHEPAHAAVDSSPAEAPHRLLTVCAASSSSVQAERRRQRYRAAAEDMEGYSVAMACRLWNVPLIIIRGISNVAGDRDKSNWKTTDAINAAVKKLATTLEQTT